ncbi:MAG: matrixin family metalloprotease [Rubrobacteraceae bacterium]
MIGHSVAYGGLVGVVARTLKFVAGFFAVAVIAVVLADEAKAQTNIQADSDGYVPVYYSCWPGNEVGIYSWYYDGYSTQGTITINQCLLDSMGAGPQDYQNVIAHEMGHAQGYGHSHDPYSTMYPTVTITGSRKRYVTIRKIKGVRPRK